MVRAALAEELARRGLTEVRPADVDLAANAIVVGQGRFGRLRLVFEAGRRFREAAAVLEEGEGPDWLRAPLGHRVEATEVSAPVTLRQEAQPLLARAFDAIFDPAWDEDEVAHTVWARIEEAAGDGRLEIRLGSEAVGWLEPNASRTLASDIERAKKKGKTLRLDGFITRAPDGFSLSVNVPGP